MQFTVTLPDLGDVPQWVRAVVGVVWWYTVAGVVIRKRLLPDEFIEKEKRKGVPLFDDDDRWSYFDRFLIWLASPIIGAVFAVAGILATALWPLSGGIVQPPWRWKK